MEERTIDRKWFNYFSNMRNKYNMRLSENKPIVVSLNAKYAFEKNRDLLYEKENKFYETMEHVVKYFTTRYSCVAIWGYNEISFLIEKTGNFIETINNEKNYRTHDIASIFSQYFFEYFNKLYEEEDVYWNCRCFNIKTEKILSYLKYKSKEIQKKVISNFLKKKVIEENRMSLVEKLKKCKEYEEFRNIEECEEGLLYYIGKKIDLHEYLNGRIIVLKDNKVSEDFFDLTNFDNLL